MWKIWISIPHSELWRVDAFELWYWRRLLRVPWTARRSNQSILKISPGCSLEGLMLKLKLQYFGHLMWRTNYWKRPWCWERLKAGGEGDDRGWVGWMASLTRWNWVWASSRRWWRTAKPGVLQSMGSQRVRHNGVTEQQQISQKVITTFTFLTENVRFLKHFELSLHHLDSHIFSCHFLYINLEKIPLLSLSLQAILSMLL